MRTIAGDIYVDFHKYAMRIHGFGEESRNYLFVKQIVVV